MPFEPLDFAKTIFTSKLTNFDELAGSLFSWQKENNPVLQKYCQGLDNAVPDSCIFLPIDLFRTTSVISGNLEPSAVYLSSTTGGGAPSRHLVPEPDIYVRSYSTSFRLFYGDPSRYCILCLLPSYLERQGSSLVVMAEGLISQSGHPDSGFYLDDFEKLAATLGRLKQQGQKTLLLGVTFALLDFFNRFPLTFPELLLMETGGMKGRRQEMVRAEVHEQLRQSAGVDRVHSEYGMTELLSQAWSQNNGIFFCPPWMKVTAYDANDPFMPLSPGKTGVLHITDLANVYSCGFIRTSDVGKCHTDGSFEVLGRLDNADIRGCSLMYL